MMKVVKGVSILILIVSMFSIAKVPAIEKPIATDSRIKTFIYNPNEIFKIVVHYNYQTSIEFAKDEEIEIISSGNNYAWQLTPVDNRLFIKPLEDNILTNMTIITNERVYQFEIQSKPYSGYTDSELVYVVRFFFPATEEEKVTPEIKQAEDKGKTFDIEPYNFNYDMTGPVKVLPTKVFDDGTKTYLYYSEDIKLTRPTIKIVKNDNTIVKVKPKIVGDYLVIDDVGKILELNFNNIIVEITNKKNYNNSE